MEDTYKKEIRTDDITPESQTDIPRYVEVPLDMGDVVHDVIFFFICTAGAFAWLMVMLLIISFVTLSYLHFDIKWMLIASAVFAVIAAVLYLRSMRRKYKGRRFVSGCSRGAVK